MKIQQLRFLCEVAANGFNVSEAALALHTAQPGISKQILLLEAELGVELFIRERNRLTGLTGAGEQVVGLARGMLDLAENIRQVAGDHTAPGAGSLVVATTHTYARHLLPKVIRTFSRRFPEVRLTVRQAPPAQIVEMVQAGDADVGLSSRSPSVPADVVLMPCYELKHSLVMPAGHPLLKLRKLSLKALAAYPIIAWDTTHEVGVKMMRKFEQARLAPRFAMRAIDSDVMKAYVAEGLGIAVIPSIAFDAELDKNLRARDVDDLFEPSLTFASIRASAYLRGYMLEFMEMFSPRLARATVEAAVRGKAGGRGREPQPAA